jgi:tRNA pseudouridine38-40 synthase|tara:strand:- start:485 stop:1351 length:867 start_codon:yes stop_codon:yes gene_type:complete
MMVAFGYHGAKFHGSQIQPDVRTVQGELKQAIERLGWWTESCLEMSSRTDSGVSVRMNLATISLPTDIANVIDESSLVSALNDHLPEDLVVWKACRVPEGTRSRIAENRLYIYRLEMIPGWPYEVEYERFSNACNLFVGQHDFTNFCRLDSGRSPIRNIESCQPWQDSSGRIVGFTVLAESFLWNQIRRMASSLHKFAKNDIELDEIALALEKPEETLDFGLAPADGLILWSLGHRDFSHKFEIPNIIEGISIPPKGKRAHKQWLNLAKMENSSILEREWLRLIQDVE